MRVIRLIPILLLQVLSLQAQRAELSRADARKAFADQNFAAGIVIYERLVERGEDDDTVRLQLGLGYFKIRDFDASFKWYEPVFKNGVGNWPAQHLFNFAELLLMKGEPDRALPWYRAYGEIMPGDTRVRRKVSGIQSIKERGQAKDYRIEEVSFNTRSEEFSTAFFRDGIVFVSDRRDADAAHEGQSDGPYLDLYFAGGSEAGFKQPVYFDRQLNSDLHEGPVVFYNNDRNVILTRNMPKRRKREDERVVLHLQLLSSVFDSTRSAWQEPVLLPINEEEYSYGHPAIDAKANRLYFASNMPGGYGGTDIYQSDRRGEGWSAPKNLGPRVNTEGNELFPFILQDSVLFFSSDGHAGMGGLDIYRYAFAADSVYNLLPPINSPADDFAFIRRDSIGYFSSNRRRVDNRLNDDVYKVTYQRDRPKPEASPVVTVPAEEKVVGETTMVEAEPQLEAEIFYTIQILALKNPKTVSRRFLKDLKGVKKHDGKDGLHRYTYGIYASPDDAQQMLTAIKEKGYLDAFIRKEMKYKELSVRDGVVIYKD